MLISEVHYRHAIAFSVFERSKNGLVNVTTRSFFSLCILGETRLTRDTTQITMSLSNVFVRRKADFRRGHIIAFAALLQMHTETQMKKMFVLQDFNYIKSMCARTLYGQNDLG